MAREFAIVRASFWTGETGRKIREFGGDAQRVALYLITCGSSNLIGLYYLPVPTLCHEVGITLQGAWKALRCLSEAHFAYYDAPSEVVFVPEMAAIQVGESLKPADKRIKAIIREWQKHRKCLFYNDFYQRYGVPFYLPDPSPLKAPYEPLRSQEQDQDQDKDQEQDTSTVGSPNGKKRKVRSDAYCEAFELWWMAYPRKEGKGSAYRAWIEAGKRIREQRKLDSRQVAEVLLYKATEYAESPRGHWPIAKLPHPSTWLNDCRYDDDPSAWQVPFVTEEQRGLFAGTRDPRGNLAVAEEFKRDLDEMEVVNAG